MPQIEHFIHMHPLMLTEEVDEKIPDEVVCRGCLESLAGPFYGCSDCEFYLHKSCAEVPREIQYLSHPCPLVLNFLSFEQWCNVCFKRFSGFSYSCERCGFDMHVKCTQALSIFLAHSLTHVRVVMKLPQAWPFTAVTVISLYMSNAPYFPL
ncbi:hypothetical protein DITRI_Ditri17bG0104900 [Diplodiscus trichospermus]